MSAGSELSTYAKGSCPSTCPLYKKQADSIVEYQKDAEILKFQNLRLAYIRQQQLQLIEKREAEIIKLTFELNDNT